MRIFGVQGGQGRQEKNIQHPTPNAQHPMAQARGGGGFFYWTLDVECWVLDVLPFCAFCTSGVHQALASI
jgi:hypothetical protein